MSGGRSTQEDNIVWRITTEYEFRVVSPQGKLIKRIMNDCWPEKLTKEDQKKRSKEIWGDGPVPSDVRVEWPASFPAFQDFTMNDQGWLLVRTYEKTEDPAGSHYDIFNGEGRYVARVLLAQRPRLWKKSKLYTIEEDEEGYRSVKRYAVEWEPRITDSHPKKTEAHKDPITLELKSSPIPRRLCLRPAKERGLLRQS